YTLSLHAALPIYLLRTPVGTRIIAYILVKKRRHGSFDLFGIGTSLQKDVRVESIVPIALEVVTAKNGAVIKSAECHEEIGMPVRLRREIFIDADNLQVIIVGDRQLHRRNRFEAFANDVGSREIFLCGFL